MLTSDLSYYSDAYVAVKGRVNVKATPNVNVDQKDVTIKNNAPFGVQSKLFDKIRKFMELL